MSLHQKAVLANVKGLPPRAMQGASRGGAGGRGGRQRDYTPVSWDVYYSRKESVNVQGDVFNIYLCGEKGPVLVLLHGGGHSGLSWAAFAKEITRVIECRVLAIDLRGHGDTVTHDDTDLSAERLSNDVVNVINIFYKFKPPPIIMMGHSMGGAIAVNVAHTELVSTLIGLIVIDVVEGTAIDACQGMQNFLNGRPKSFKSLQHAIEWAVRSGQIRNMNSAKVSMAGQVRLRGPADDETPQSTVEPGTHGIDSISEEDEEENGPSENDGGQRSSDEHNNDQDQKQDESTEWVWRIDLTKTEPFWLGWFQGLSTRFLSCSVPKVLLLAGVNRLDSELTVGQMQGKFQMVVMPQCGHALHEDAPEKVTDALATFMVRHKFANAKTEFEPMFPAC